MENLVFLFLFFFLLVVVVFLEKKMSGFPICNITNTVFAFMFFLFKLSFKNYSELWNDLHLENAGYMKEHIHLELQNYFHLKD